MNNTLHNIFRVNEEMLLCVNKWMEKRFEVSGVLEKMENAVEETLEHRLGELGITKNTSVEEVYVALFDRVKNDEKQLYLSVGVSPDNFDFHRVAQKARAITGEKTGFFLKKEYATQVLKKRPPRSTIQQLGYSSVDDMLANEDVMDVFSALRFTETDEWMHETFDVAYKQFTPADFEERPIEIRVLGDRYKEVAQKFVAKKHHNVSHLKEFGVIFVNPIAQTESGKFIRDFALLLHYTHEVVFYSKLFQKYSQTEVFNEQFISLLRGDVPEINEQKENEWLIVQRYLWKDDPQDKRLFVPRVNPEALHWHRAEQGLVEGVNLAFWDNTDFLAYPFGDNNEQTLVSFDLEDTAMSFVAYNKGEQARFTYHQQEALWNKFFSLFVGGYDQMEQYIIDNMANSKIEM